jgi:hypothetical protein
MQFSLNGGCGYVLKPEWMLPGLTATLGGGDASAARRANPLPDRAPRTMLITIYSAHVAQGSNCSFFRDDLYLQVRGLLSVLLRAFVLLYQVKLYWSNVVFLPG